MEDTQKKLLEVFRESGKVILKDISINASQMRFEIRAGGGGIPPQIPVRIQYNNQTFIGMVSQNISTSKKNKED